MSTDLNKSSSYPPSRLAGLRPFQPGKSGHPGGNHTRSPKVSNALCKLLALNDEQFAAYEPVNKADKLAYKLIKDAETSTSIKQLVAAFREIADRTEGKPLQTREVVHTVAPESRQAIMEEAYLMLFSQRTRDESLRAINAVYDALEAGDTDRAREATAEAIAEDMELIGGVWSAAEAVVTGSGG